MTIIRRSAGQGAFVLSVVGLLLCLAGAASVWAGKGRVDIVAAALFGTADEAFAFMQTRLERVSQALDKSRQRVSGLSNLAERLRTTEADLSAEFEPLAQTLDEVYSELQAAEQWLDALQAVAAGVNRVSEAIALSDAAGLPPHEEGSDGASVTAKKVAEFSASVADALARVQVMRQELIDRRENSTLAREFAAATITRVAELDERLAKLSARIGAFKAQVSTARASFVDLGGNIHWWSTFATVTLIVVLLWFGVSQIGMMKHGCRFARSSVAA